MSREALYLTRGERELHTAALLKLAEQHGGLSAELRQRYAHQVGVSDQTLRRWLRNAGHGAAQRQAAFVITDEHLAHIAAHPTLKAAWARMRAAGMPLPCYPNFTKAIKAVDPALLAGVRLGRAAMAEQELYVRQQPRVRNEEWQIDHAVLPLRVQRMIGKPIQPVLTVVIDSATRLVVATALWEGMPNAEQALAAVAKAVHGRHVDGTFVGGVPGALRSDRGAELIGRTMTNGLIRLGVVADPTQSRAPFEKGIVERWIRTLKDEFVSSLPGWTGGPTNHAGTSVLAVPEADLLWFSDLEARLDSWVARYNTCRVHGTLGVTPIQAWRADTNAIGVADEQAVAHLALQAERSKRKTGIQLHNIDYIAVELRSVGKRVRVAYLPNEYGYVWVHAGAAGWAKAVPELSEDDHVRLLAARKAASAKVTVVHRHARELRAHDEQASAVEGAARDLGLVEEPQTPVAALPKADQVEDVLARMARLLGDAS